MWKPPESLNSLLFKRPRKRFWALVLTVALLTVGLPSWANVTHKSTQFYAQKTDLIRQAQQNYEQGDFQQAINDLETAINQFERTGDRLQKAVALGNLSLAYQGLRNWSAAQDAIEQSLHTLGVTPNDLPLEITGELDQPSLLASTLDIYGQLWQKQGDFARAFEIWQQAATLHQTTDNPPAWLGNQINQIRALEALGLYQQARVTAEQVGCALGEAIENVTCSVTTFTSDALPPGLKSQGLRSLSDTLRQVGELELSRDILENSLANADTLQERQAILLSLGNTYEALGTREKERATSDNRQGIIPWRFVLSDEGLTEAEDSYKEAENYLSQVLDNTKTHPTCPSLLTETANQIQLTSGVICLAVQLEQNVSGQETQSLWNSLYKHIVNETTPNRKLVYTSIRLAKQGAYLNQMANTDVIGWERIIGLLHKAINDAQQLQDKPAESYGRGNLGGLYEYFDWVERNGRQQIQSGVDAWAKANALTQEALLLAQPAMFPEIAYQWQWQLARLTLAENCENCSPTDKQAQTSQVINTYEQAIGTLEQVREGLLSINADIQFSFRDNIEPIYRELVDLKLQTDNPTQEDLNAVVKSIDKLQIAELESFLRCRLNTTQLEQQDIDPHAAVLYPIILRDRMEVILALPDKSLYRRSPSIPPQQLKGETFQKYVNLMVNEFRTSLNRRTKRKRVKEIAKDLYGRIIAPFESELEGSQAQPESTIETLVFVLDGDLRNFPVAALLDNETDNEKVDSYLIEQYAVAVAPSLQLIAPEPLPRPLQVLAGGLSFKDHPTFSELPSAVQEVNTIQSLFKGSEKLLEQELTRNNFIKTLTEKEFPIVHLATHGEFSSDPDATFIELADGPFYAADFNSLLSETLAQSNSIKLLVLSACQTATGDKRALLGIAGLAVRSGANSALSTLWSVNDKSAAALMPLFYEELQANSHITKAEALRQAQLKLLKNDKNKGWDKPYHWAPYTLVGNWR